MHPGGHRNGLGEVEVSFILHLNIIITVEGKPAQERVPTAFTATTPQLPTSAPAPILPNGSRESHQTVDAVSTAVKDARDIGLGRLLESLTPEEVWGKVNVEDQKEVLFVPTDKDLLASAVPP